VANPDRLDGVDPEWARRAASFEGVAEIYERSRPDYPRDAVRWLVGDANRVLDLGAGTGKLTRVLVDAGLDVVAVEPSGAMLEELRRAVPAEAHVGSAEDIPLPDASVDAVTVAQAFHWFDYQPALREIARVLRPDGRLGLVWNVRDDSVPWVARVSEVIGAENMESFDLAGIVAESRLFGPVERTSFDHAQRVDRAQLLELVASRSQFATAPPDEQERLRAAVADLWDKEGGDGELELRYVTEAYRATLLRRPDAVTRGDV
jgi:SAM-dependent methyltransferase